jgi:ATP-dependent DNA helicase RecG
LIINKCKFIPDRLNLNIGLLTGTEKGKKVKYLLDQLEAGELVTCLGIHKLIENLVFFKNLGLVVVDEQLRFGVIQRSKI